jgi:hypothetical protein
MFTLLFKTVVGILYKGSCVIVPAHKVTEFLVFIASGLLVPEQMHSSAKPFPSSTVSKSWNILSLFKVYTSVKLRDTSSFLIIYKEYSSEVLYIRNVVFVGSETDPVSEKALWREITGFLTSLLKFLGDLSFSASYLFRQSRFKGTVA